MQFNLVICGLDSVEARRWMNATLVNLVDPENPESLKPLIDGGTEGVHYLELATSSPTEFRQICRFQRSSARYPSHCIVLL
jgi:molybdopterin/thiamine biosynthesis adenylyltransferase